MSARNNVLLPPTYVFEANIAVLCNITRNWKQNKKQQKEPKHFVWRDLKCFVCSCMPSKISFVCVLNPSSDYNGSRVQPENVPHVLSILYYTCCGNQHARWPK